MPKPINAEQWAKHWKIIEVQLNQAAQFLTEPDRFRLEERELSQYHDYVDNNEFELAMDELAEIAREFGGKSGFWRRLKKPAMQMNLPDKAAQYEALFQKALARDA